MRRRLGWLSGFRDAVQGLTLALAGIKPAERRASFDGDSDCCAGGALSMSGGDRRLWQYFGGLT